MILLQYYSVTVLQFKQEIKKALTIVGAFVDLK